MSEEKKYFVKGFIMCLLLSVFVATVVYKSVQKQFNNNLNNKECQKH